MVLRSDKLPLTPTWWVKRTNDPEGLWHLAIRANFGLPNKTALCGVTAMWSRDPFNRSYAWAARQDNEPTKQCRKCVGLNHV